MNTKQPTRTRPHGITLVEVLMSTMVVMLGILGLISLIPLGSHLAERGTRSDRIASVGRRVYRDVIIRRVLNPAVWLDPPIISVDPMTNAVYGGQQSFLGTNRTLPVRQAYLIDPMMYDFSSLEFNASFPAFNDPRRNFPLTPLVYPSPEDPQFPLIQMRRLSLGAATTNFPMMNSRAELAFVSDDDYGVGNSGGYVRPKERDNPLVQQFFQREIDGVPDLTAADNVRRQTLGTYSWAIMLVPELYATDLSYPIMAPDMFPPISSGGLANAYIKIPSTDIYTMSTIIFQNRAGDIPTAEDYPTATVTPSYAGDPTRYRNNERVFYVVPGSFISGGATTGEIQLATVPGDAATATDADVRLDLKVGEWICLAKRVEALDASNNPVAYVGDVFKWYRIVARDDAIDSLSGGQYGRRFSIDGPDWNSDPAQTPTQAIYMQDVVGVYERKVRLETGTF